MKRAQRVWAGALLFGFVLSVAHSLGLPIEVSSSLRALCSLAVAGAALIGVARDSRMTWAAGAFVIVVWVDVVLLTVDASLRDPVASDAWLALVGIGMTIVGYIIMGTIPMPDDRRGAYAATAWVLFGGVTVASLLVEGMHWVRLVTLALAVALSMRSILGLALFERHDDDSAAARGLRVYRFALLAQVVTAMIAWSAVQFVEAPAWVTLTVLIPSFAMVFGIARYASSRSHWAASFGAVGCALMLGLELLGTAGWLPAWHARLVALIALAALCASLARFVGVVAYLVGAGFIALPVVARFAPAWTAALVAIGLIGVYLHLIRRAEQALA